MLDKTKTLFEIQNLYLIPWRGDPRKEIVSRGPRLNCPEISENCPPTGYLSTKKPGKIPVLHAVNDKYKNMNIHSLLEANLWNVCFTNSARTPYYFP